MFSELTKHRQDPGQQLTREATTSPVRLDATRPACLSSPSGFCTQKQGDLRAEQTRRGASSIVIESVRRRKYCMLMEFKRRGEKGRQTEVEI